MDENHTRSAWPPHSYENISYIQACYESMVMSSQMGTLTRSISPLIHKASFAYEYGRWIPGAAPETRSACRHAVGHGGHRRAASAVSPVVVTPPGARRGWRAWR